MKILLTAISMLLLSGQIHAGELDRFITKLKLPTGQIIVVAEGDFEARSIGSFSARLYEAASAQDETTFFTSGLIHLRDGMIEKVILNDITGDQRPEIIIFSRSVGTGSYLSAYAFFYTKNELYFRTAVEGLPPDVNLIIALKEKHEEEK